MRPRHGRRHVPRGTSGFELSEQHHEVREVKIAAPFGIHAPAVTTLTTLPSRDEGEEGACDRLVLGLGGESYAFSLAKRSALPDLPDRRYRLRGVAFWAEIKRPPRPNERKDGYVRWDAGDQLSQGQLDFLLAEYRCNEVVFAGDRAMLQRMVLARPSDWRRLGHEAVAEIVARGLRKET